MGRFDKILKPYEMKPEDHNTYDKMEPRNLLADNLNPLLDKYINPIIEKDYPILEKLGLNSNIRIPEVSVADRKDMINKITDPEELVTNMGIGSIKNTNLIKEILGDMPDVILKKLDTSKSTDIAKMFEEMKHNPNDPEVKAAYEALNKEVIGQYDKFIKAGFNPKKITGENPYKTSKDLFDDIENKQIQYFPTSEGFGSSKVGLDDNPMLKGSGRKIDDEELLNNDIFRIVHDLVGHGSNKNSFGPLGEEIGYQTHKMSLSPLAQKALTTETRGQNSYVNYGPNGAANRANPADTIYADQKIGLLPDEALEGGNHKFVEQLGDSPRYKALRSILNSEEDK